MTFLLDNWLLVFIALASGAMLFWPALSGGSGTGAVATPEAIRLMNREKAVLLDIRDAAEFAGGHAVGAKSTPVAELEGSKNLPANKQTPVILMCASGQRSNRAAAALRKLGHTQVVVLQGGLNAWREANLPTEKAA